MSLPCLSLTGAENFRPFFQPVLGHVKTVGGIVAVFQEDLTNSLKSLYFTGYGEMAEWSNALVC